MADSPLDILKSYEQKIINALRDSLDKNGKVSAKGLLKASIKVRFEAFATKHVINIDMLEYWKWVDEGRQPGGKQPPIEAMLKHIADRGDWHAPKVKNIQNFYKDKKGIHKRKKPLQADKARRQLAFLIARGIKKKGIKPSYFVEEAFEGSLFNDLTRDMSKALSREITIILKAP